MEAMMDFWEMQTYGFKIYLDGFQEYIQTHLKALNKLSKKIKLGFREWIHNLDIEIVERSEKMRVKFVLGVEKLKTLSKQIRDYTNGVATKLQSTICEFSKMFKNKLLTQFTEAANYLQQFEITRDMFQMAQDFWTWVEQLQLVDHLEILCNNMKR